MDLSPDQLYVEEDVLQVSPQDIELNRAIMESLRPVSPPPQYTMPQYTVPQPYVPPPQYTVPQPYVQQPQYVPPPQYTVPPPYTPSPYTVPTQMATPATRPLTRPLTVGGPTQCPAPGTLPALRPGTPPALRPQLPLVPTLPFVPTGRETVVTGRKVDEEDEANEDLLLTAIALSMEAAEHARNAINLAELEYDSPIPDYDPETFENRFLRAEQDRAYEEAVRIDRERQDAALRAAEEARLAGEAAEQAARLVQEARELERAKREALKPPLLRYAIDVGDKANIYTLRFRLYDGSTVTHAFHRAEPISSLFQQLRFDLRDAGELRLTMQPRKLVDCGLDTSIEDCGVTDRSTIIVERV